MNFNTNNAVMPESGADVAKRRLLSVKGDPMVFADWKRVVFLHFDFPAEVLRRQIRGPFELELHEGRGVVTLVALTMQRSRPARVGLGCCLWPLREQRFLNLRTYVRCQDESGALFLWGWLSRPFGLPLPAGFGLPFSFISANYRHEPESGMIQGEVTDGHAGGRLAYRATTEVNKAVAACAPGSLAAFALERYTGFFNHEKASSVFRAWHPPWQQNSVEVTLEDLNLVTNKFPWFSEGRFAGANYAPGFDRVWLGGAHRLEKARSEAAHRRLSAFYRMP